MGAHGGPWGPMGTHGAPWGPMGPHGGPNGANVPPLGEIFFRKSTPKNEKVSKIQNVNFGGENIKDSTRISARFGMYTILWGPLFDYFADFNNFAQIDPMIQDP